MALSVTANQLIADASLMAGIGDQYNAADAATIQAGLRLLNDALDSWSGEPRVVFVVTEGVVTLPTNGTNTVTLPSGTVLERPAEVRDVSVVDSNGYRYPVRIIGTDEWSSITIPTATGRPERVYFDYGVPTMTSYWYPTPSFSGDTAHIWYGTQLTQFSALTQTLVAPQGYSLAIKCTLAELLCLAFGKEPSPTLQRTSRRAKRVITLGHNQPKRLPVPWPLMSRTAYNVNTDSQ
jgi:hypothetical protein